MRGSFIHHRILKKRKMRKRICALTAVLLAAICLLSACGPETGAEEWAGQDSGAMFGGEQGTDRPQQGAEQHPPALESPQHPGRRPEQGPVRQEIGKEKRLDAHTVSPRGPS